MKTIIIHVLNFFGSVVLTIALLIILLLTSLLSALPIRDVPMSIIYSSWLFIVFISVLFLNILVCTCFRFKSIFSERKKSKKIFIQGLGSLILHMGFLIILVGGAVSGLSDRKEFNLLIAEGDTRALTHEDAIFPGYADEISSDTVKLKKFSVPFHKGGTVQKDLISDLAFFDKDSDSEIVKQVRAGQPANFKGYELIITQYGFAPRFVLKDASEKVLFAPHVYLATSKGLASEDTFPLANSSLLAHVIFFPDAVAENNTLKGISPQLRNPMAQIDIISNEKVIASEIVGVDESLEFKSNSLTMTDIRYWNLFTVIAGGYGPGILYTGFCMAILGLIMRFTIPLMSSIEHDMDE